MIESQSLSTAAPLPPLAVAASEGAYGGQLLDVLAQAGLCREIWQRWQELGGEDQAVRSALLEQAHPALV